MPKKTPPAASIVGQKRTKNNTKKGKVTKAKTKSQESGKGKAKKQDKEDKIVLLWKYVALQLFKFNSISAWLTGNSYYQLGCEDRNMTEQALKKRLHSASFLFICLCF